MIRLRICHLFLLVVSLAIDESQAADYYEAAADDGNAYYAAADDGGNDYYAAADDGGNEYYAAGDDGGYGGGDDYATPDDYVGDDYIKYWTEYAVLPKKCISYNNVDMIVYSVYEQAYQHCMDTPVGTYMTPVPTFVTAYVNQLDANAAEQGLDDYVSAYSDFINCYEYETASGLYYAQLGCTDDDSQTLSVGLFSDATCETPDKDANGMDDLNFDVSAIQVPFKECKSCVNFVDKNEDDVDDQYFENKMTNAPLCSTIWADKSTCDRKCKRLGFNTDEGWNSSDQVLLGVLGVFSAIMLAVILKKRQKMSNKDALIEEAALGAIGLQQNHIIGAFVLVLFIVAIFAFFRMKAITWGLLLIINTIVFGYLMKLTITSGLAAGRTVGPDGQLIEREDSSSDEDDDDDDDGDEEEKGKYKSPEIPPIT